MRAGNRGRRDRGGNRLDNWEDDGMSNHDRRLCRIVAAIIAALWIAGGEGGELAQTADEWCACEACPECGEETIMEG